MAERAGVLVAAGGAPWEVDALRVVGSIPTRAVVLKRCVDLADLLASAATGQSRVAVVSSTLPGLDADSISRLAREGVTLLAVVTGTDGELLPGVFDAVAETEIGRLAELVPAAASHGAGSSETARPALGPAPAVDADAAGPVSGGSGVDGRVIAVWGPTGAPGRTTVAVGLAAELAGRGHDSLLVDADGYGGAVAQHLGVLDEMSGLLGAVRLANAGQLDVLRLAAHARQVSPNLRVLTGLPRADRWVEVRPAAFDVLLDTARSLCPFVVLDLGFNVEQETQAYAANAPQRNHMTVSSLDQADEVVVVGSADPVGLARLARSLVEVHEVVPTGSLRVVVNRARPALGWGEPEVRAMVEGFVVPRSMHFLPDDPAATDRALVAGRPPRELGDSPLVRAITRVADSLAGEVAEPSGRRGAVRLRRRRAGRAR